MSLFLQTITTIIILSVPGVNPAVVAPVVVLMLVMVAAVAAILWWKKLFCFSEYSVVPINIKMLVSYSA